MKKFDVPGEVSAEEFELRVLRSRCPVMVFFFDPESTSCAEYAPYVMEAAESLELPHIAVYSVNEKRFPELRKRFEMDPSSNLLFIKNGKKFDESPLNRRGAGMIIREMTSVPLSEYC